MIGIFFLLFGVSLVSAHSPSAMSLTYDLNSNTLSVSITHTVSNPDSHYVRNVKIDLNEVEAESVDYTSQPSSSDFTYTYTITAVDGDEFEVSAFCNQGGSISKTLTVTEGGMMDDDATDDTTDDSTDDTTDDDSDANGGISGYSLFWLILPLGVTIGYIYHRRRN